MKIPGYPSNREADERTHKPLLNQREGVLVGWSEAGRPVCAWQYSWGGVQL